MKVYFDTCCYGRPFDDRTQATIDDEAIAVMTAVDVCQIIDHVIVGSVALTFELSRIRDPDKRADIENFFNNTIDEFIVMPIDGGETKETARAAELQTQGLGVMDSHHLAIAELSAVDILLTTDKDFLSVAARIDTPVKVMNPLNFLPEATK